MEVTYHGAKVQVGNLFVNERGFVYASGFRICRLTTDGRFEFLGAYGAKILVDPAALKELCRQVQEHGLVGREE